MRSGALPLLAMLSSAVTVGSLARVVLPPPVRLATRVRPYTVSIRSALGAPADVGVIPGGDRAGRASQPLRLMVEAAARRLGRLLERATDEATATRIRQAGILRHVREEDRLAAYRTRQLGSVVGWAGTSLVVSSLLHTGTTRALALAALGLIVGATRQRGRLERAVDERRARMRIEIYTVNQLLAIRVRAGGGVVQAVQHLVWRGSGEVVGELSEALRLHRAGLGAAEALTRIARSTPEPFCARTYALLAAAEARGADLAAGLRSLSEDVREARREAIRRAATRRRAGMLVPIIAILAPVMLLFVGAPLPHLVLNWR